MNTAFVSRLQHLIAHYDLSAASFADKVGVPRSSISHLLSERNKPSLDFVMKVVKTFPEVNLYWLLNGKGNFPGLKNSPEEGTSLSSASLLSNTNSSSKKKQAPVLTDSSQKTAVKVIVLYDDGSFESFDPKK